ncbi:hypothetical protein ANN_01885 [Periplaneta americana]|uniref:Endonuclease-reverse transcriptase n=1 Tax=Periplaneta americana TaxID=6978 RepID=A0ABQ8TUR3_PERAM|nr:hypothetical protein ANN_01885 [Periplaneta americana]
MFENKVLKIFGTKRDEVTGEWRKLHKAELHAFYSPPDIIRNIKSRRLRWAGHVARMGEYRNAYKSVSWEAEGKKTFGEVETPLAANAAFRLVRLNSDFTAALKLEDNCVRNHRTVKMLLPVNSEKHTHRSFSRTGEACKWKVNYSIDYECASENSLTKWFDERVNCREKLLSSSLLSKNLKVRIYKTVILPVLLYGCETWTLTLREEHRLRVFENKVLRKIFGAKRDEVTGEWRKLHNTELHALYSSPDIIRNLKSRRLRWAGHVARMGESRNAYRVLVGRPEGKRPLGRPRRRWEDNIKMDLREVGYDDRDWLNLAQDRDRWRAYVRAAMNLRFLKSHL